MKHLLLLTACAAALFAATEKTPAPADAQRPNWSATPDGSALLSWLEPAKNGEYTLRYAVRGTAWSEPRTVIANRSFFRHPAEVPQVMQFGPAMWMAQWVEQGEDEAEFLYVSTSTDGIKWTAPQRAHKDTKPVQHGLVSMIQTSPTEVSLFWLLTPDGEDGPGFLMRSVVTTAGKYLREETIDRDVCSCCPTTVAKTTRGLLVAYRDRSEFDIRDISVVRYEGGKWTVPKNVHADGWKLTACPINGPTVAAQANHAAVAWFTGASDAPKVQLSLSEDGGATFAAPIVLSTSRAHGFPGLAMAPDGTAVVAWVEQADDTSRLMVRRISAKGVAGPAEQLARGERATFGYPKVLHTASGDWVAWGASKMQAAKVE